MKTDDFIKHMGLKSCDLDSDKCHFCDNPENGTFKSTDFFNGALDSSLYVCGVCIKSQAENYKGDLVALTRTRDEIGKFFGN